MRAFYAAVCALAMMGLCNGVQAQSLTSGETKKEIAQEIKGDTQALKEQHQEMISNMETAKGEEQQLREQLKAALKARDAEKAESLRNQLKEMHRENVQEMHQDRRELRQERRELKQDLKDARDAGMRPPRRRGR
jgi:phage/plasmid primase-like uncharacterized protein